MKLLALALLFAVSFVQADSITIGGQNSLTPTLTAYDYTGWAPCGMRYQGVELIDAYDHGRCLQSAVVYDQKGEADNPTFAGTYLDGLIPRASSSQPITFQADALNFKVDSWLAYWNPIAGRVLSDTKLSYAVRMRSNNKDAVQKHTVIFTMPATQHTQAQFEILTGYMPASFSKFRTYNPTTGALADLSDGPGEQALPIIFCQPDNLRCMGIYSPRPLILGGYGRWRFLGSSCMTAGGATGCVKWNAVSRINNPLRNIEYRFEVFTAVGSLSAVMSAIRWASLNP